MIETQVAMLRPILRLMPDLCSKHFAGLIVQFDSDEIKNLL